MKVVVIGVGHVGLITAATMAHLGHEVVGLDDDGKRIAALQQGETPFFEPGLKELLERVGAGPEPRLRFEADYAKAMPGADVAFICVGTPSRPDGEANLVAVENAASEAARHAEGEVVLVQKSTVPVMTSDRLKKLFGRLGSTSIHLACNPEFLREGSAVADSIDPDRILVGAEDEVSHTIMRRLYRPLIDRGTAYFETDIRTAELAKHACNAFLAMKISFVNALARISEASGADVTSIADVMGRDRRIGRDFLNASAGFGGYCLPKDVAAFKATAKRFGYDFGLLDEVLRINSQALDAAYEKIKDSLWNLEGKRVVLFGLAFKDGTDDVRESPALKLAQRLIDAGVTVGGYDPYANQAAAAEVPELQIFDDPYRAAEGCDCIVICTPSATFTALDLTRLKGEARSAVIVDTCNLLDRNQMAASGFTYVPNGRPPVNL